MIRPNTIPRTLIGGNGERFYDIPGLVYPKEVLYPQPIEKDDELSYEVPPWGISTDEAAAMLNCLNSSARVLMRKHGITRVMVRRRMRPPISYWHKGEIEALIQRRVKEVNSMPKQYLNTEEACHLLNISHTTLYRFIRYGKIKGMRVRFRSEKGIRLRYFFNRSEVRLLRYHIEALKRKQ